MSKKAIRHCILLLVLLAISAAVTWHFRVEGEVGMYAALTFAGAWVFWALYVFTMGVYRAKKHGRLSGLNLVLSFPVVLVAVIVDWFSNWFIAPFVFLDWPREPLVTARLQRYMAQEHNGWRKRWATYICNSVLDPFDPDDNHC